VTWETDIDMRVSNGLEAHIRGPFQGSVGHIPGKPRKSTENLSQGRDLNLILYE
jgi:hypothetical protein